MSEELHFSALALLAVSLWAVVVPVAAVGPVAATEATGAVATVPATGTGETWTVVGGRAGGESGGAVSAANGAGDSNAIRERGAGGGGAAAAAARDAPELRSTGELRLTPDRPGEIGVQLRYVIPDSVTELQPILPIDATVTATDGFEGRDGGGYAWDGTTDRPTLTYRLPANVTLAESQGQFAIGETERRVAIDGGDERIGETGRRVAIDGSDERIDGTGRRVAIDGSDERIDGTGRRVAIDGDDERIDGTGRRADESGGQVRTTTPGGGRAQTTTPSDGRYVFADPGPWALVRVPRVSVRIRGSGARPTFAREWTVRGPGAIGGTTAFLGEHREHRRTVDGQTIRLVVPAAANLTEEPAALLSSLGGAADALRVGGRDEEVFFVAAPRDGVSWGVRGVTVGDADSWVLADLPLDVPGNPWLHEYVHTRQEYVPTNETRWFTEGSAQYYGALLTLQQGRIGFDSFAGQLEKGTDSPDAGAVLATPSTWTRRAPYTKGSLVAGELDRRIRLATGGGRSLTVVFRLMNRRGGPVDADAFAGILGSVGNESVPRIADRYAGTSAAPEMWDRERQRAAFGPLPAHVTYELPRESAPDGLRVRGPYREGAVGGDWPAVVVVGETLDVDVRVRNDGDEHGEYELEVRVDGRTVERRSERIDAETTRVETVSHTFGTTGNRTISVVRGNRTISLGPVRMPVTVRDPARARVTDVRVDRRTVAVGERVTITAAVANRASVPGRSNVTFVADDAPFATRTAHLAPGGSTTLSANRSFDAAGEHELGVADAGSVTVAVQPASATAGNATGRPAATPTRRPAATARPGATATQTRGFGPGATLVAIVALGALLAAGLRRRR
jgi:hypothetical protein